MRRKLTVVAVIVIGIAVVLAGVWIAKTAADNAARSNDKPSVTQTAEPSSSPTADKPAEKTASLSLFYVAVGDEGKSGTEIGCGDSLVMTTTEKVTFTDQVKVSVERLLANHDQYLGESGLFNALAQSQLSYVSSTVSGDTVTVNLTGKLSSGGACDDPRIVAQLEQTAKVAAGVGEAVVNIDGVTVQQRLSAR